ncbi:MAG TPA: hypothetical protein VLV83_14270 [Acidobacteriota bacterium]|nr:hypothetical protein [Acidobacteriota bacterium]
MPRRERMREIVDGLPSEDFFSDKEAEGWKLVSMEFERPADGEDAARAEDSLAQDVPYGLQVGSDCYSLEENPDERRALVLMLEQLIADKKLSEVATALNQEGLRTRGGEPWTSLDIFNLFPRLIDVAPIIYPSADWEAVRRRGLIRAAG